MVETNKPLTVYKASAGSGKTFTLAAEYIKLLIREPDNYRFILAVTFTNKATEEMKIRILSQLYGIGHALSDSEDYMDRMRETFPKMADKDIRDRALQALNLILHHYSYFRVETIDSFFQSILRNLARELGLTANLNVSLNDTETKDQAVDNIIEDIDKDNDPILGWIMDYVQEKMDDEKNWNVIGQIKDFGKLIFKEFYKSHQDELRLIMNDPNFFKHYTEKLRTMKAEANETMANYAQAFLQIINDNHLEDKNFSRGNQNAPGYFTKLASGDYNDPKIPNSYITNAIEDPSSMIKKADLGKPESEVIIEQVGPLLAKAEKERQRACIVLNSVELTLDNLNQLRLLGRIEEEVRRINNVNNNYPLSSTQKLLNDLIDKQDSPFIYEKIGGQLKYIMIDEFQDTSTVQWSNFKVLLDDCLAHNNGSLIVGDVKQSIYRWRNGDWRLLQCLSPQNDSRIHLQPLDTNWRSKRNIILFNNAFFSLGSQLTTNLALADLQSTGASTQLLHEAANISSAYGDVKQMVSKKHRDDDEDDAGSVSIQLISSKEYEANMILEVQHTIELLLSKGIEQKKIAILVRRNKHIQDLALYFQQHPITVDGEEKMVSMVSDEAFRLDASLAVNTLVMAMRWLTKPQDRLVTASLVKAYRKVCGDADKPDDTSLFVDKDSLWSDLPSDIVDLQLQLLTIPLMDLAERLYQIFELNRLEGQSAYVCAFFDQLTEFMKNNITGIEEFIQEWDNTISSKTIHSDEIDGIRLLTIHKSKGLEFDNVIIPYCDWDIEKTGDILWMSPQEAPYKDLPIVPVKLSAKKLKSSIYSEEYLSEHLKSLVDNLNLLYVAFTRAGRNLFIIGKKDSAKWPSQLISGVLQSNGIDMRHADEADQEPQMVSLHDLLPNWTLENEEHGSLSFRFGNLCPSEEKAIKQTLNVFEQTEKGVKVKIENYMAKVKFRQSNNSIDFVTPDDELEQQEKRRSYIQTGNILHALFASIQNINDIPQAIDDLEFNGILYDKPLTRQELRRIIDERMKSKQVADWLSPHWKVFNECTILAFDESEGRVREHRPDRVIYDDNQIIVIDFKTGAEHEAHHDQVRRYMDLLRNMGYQNVSGYLWYIRTNRVTAV